MYTIVSIRSHKETGALWIEANEESVSAERPAKFQKWDQVQVGMSYGYPGQACSISVTFRFLRFSQKSC